MTIETRRRVMWAGWIGGDGVSFYHNYASTAAVTTGTAARGMARAGVAAATQAESATNQRRAANGELRITLSPPPPPPPPIQTRWCPSGESPLTGSWCPPMAVALPQGWCARTPPQFLFLDPPSATGARRPGSIRSTRAEAEPGRRGAGSASAASSAPPLLRSPPTARSILSTACCARRCSTCASTRAGSRTAPPPWAPSEATIM
mmetsp:Transcript_34616/g.86848  ORF Transcript_34616/g.86848 Transcript_34616/m.86848 type:complete len:205 (+) Transcript_34616:1473-2087(+)